MKSTTSSRTNLSMGSLRDKVQELEGLVLELEAEKVAMVLGMECMAEQLCCCSCSSEK